MTTLSKTGSGQQLAQQANRGGRVAKEFADGSLVFAENCPRWLCGILDPTSLTDGRSI